MSYYEKQFFSQLRYKLQHSWYSIEPYKSLWLILKSAGTKRCHFFVHIKWQIRETFFCWYSIEPYKSLWLILKSAGTKRCHFLSTLNGKLRKAFFVGSKHQNDRSKSIFCSYINQSSYLTVKELEKSNLKFEKRKWEKEKVIFQNKKQLVSFQD